MLNSLIKAVSWPASMLLTIIGLWEIPSKINQFLGEGPWATGVSFVCFVILVVFALSHFITPSLLARFGHSGHAVIPILSQDKELVLVDSNFKARIITDKTLIYPATPEPHDLVDLLEVFLNGEQLDEQIYQSSDSDIVSIKQKTPKKIAIQWRPKTKIIPFVPYNHRTEYLSPSPYGDEAFFQLFHVDADTGLIEFTFKCEHPLERAIAFVMPPRRHNVTFRDLYKFAYEGRHRAAEQPQLLDDHTVQWTLITPKRNRTYGCFVFYRGGFDTFRNKIDSQRWHKRLVQRIKGVSRARDAIQQGTLVGSAALMKQKEFVSMTRGG